MLYDLCMCTKYELCQLYEFFMKQLKSLEITFICFEYNIFPFSKIFEKFFANI